MRQDGVQVEGRDVGGGVVCVDAHHCVGPADESITAAQTPFAEFTQQVRLQQRQNSQIIQQINPCFIVIIIYYIKLYTFYITPMLKSVLV